MDNANLNSIYSSTITKIGKHANDMLIDNLLITFKEGVPADLADFCFIHSHGVLLSELTIGNSILLGNKKYIITAVGDVASKNFSELGHITLRFDGNNTAELPGTVHVAGEKPEQLVVGDVIIINNTL